MCKNKTEMINNIAKGKCRLHRILPKITISIEYNKIYARRLCAKSKGFFI